VVGAPEMQVAFSSVTAHGAAVVGRIEGDHTTTSARDLGQIVWPVVKEAMSGVLGRTMRGSKRSSGSPATRLGQCCWLRRTTAGGATSGN
jgi:hypothetical protein